MGNWSKIAFIRKDIRKLNGKDKGYKRKREEIEEKVFS